MRTVWKQPIALRAGNFKIAAESLRVVHVGFDGEGVPCVWYEHEPREPNWSPWPTSFWVVGTGHSIPESSTHVGSFVDGPYVWHIYAEVRL